jgi:hypothetical protein
MGTSKLQHFINISTCGQSYIKAIINIQIFLKGKQKYSFRITVHGVGSNIRKSFMCIQEKTNHHNGPMQHNHLPHIKWTALMKSV